MNPAQAALALLSGLLSTLSPCVLPLIPIVMASAVAAHRWGSLALVLGLTLSFTLLGLFIATIGIGLGLDQNVFRLIAGTLLVAFGLALLIPALGERLQALIPMPGSGRGLNRVNAQGWLGQFAVGLILGLVWTPCVGPTLGAAVTLASSGQNLSQAALLMLIFGIGAALPLIAIGSLSRATLLRVRSRLTTAAANGKQLLGLLLMLVGGAALLGLDHRIEAWLVAASPQWLSALTTRY